MSDLFGNHIVGFPTRRLIYKQIPQVVRFLPVAIVVVSLFLNIAGVY